MGDDDWERWRRKEKMQSMKWLNNLMFLEGVEGSIAWCVMGALKHGVNKIEK